MTMEIFDSGTENSWDLQLTVQRKYQFDGNEDDELPATTGHTRKRVLTSSTDEEYVVMLPSTNCSLVNGDALQKVLIDNNVTSGQYCLISVLGWSYVRRVLELTITRRYNISILEHRYFVRFETVQTPHLRMMSCSLSPLLTFNHQEVQAVRPT